MDCEWWFGYDMNIWVMLWVYGFGFEFSVKVGNFVDELINLFLIILDDSW